MALSQDKKERYYRIWTNKKDKQLMISFKNTTKPMKVRVKPSHRPYLRIRWKLRETTAEIEVRLYVLYCRWRMSWNTKWLRG
jgi:hypothetical protein